MCLLSDRGQPVLLGLLSGCLLGEKAHCALGPSALFSSQSLESFTLSEHKSFATQMIWRGLSSSIRRLFTPFLASERRTSTRPLAARASGMRPRLQPGPAPRHASCVCRVRAPAVLCSPSHHSGVCSHSRFSTWLLEGAAAAPCSPPQSTPLLQPTWPGGAAHTTRRLGGEKPRAFL